MGDDRRIPAEGRLDAPIALVGEAPGENEDRLLRPFVGASGFKLNSWWQPLGLSHSDFWKDNVYPFRPPHNNIDAIPEDDLNAWANDLHYRVAELVDPYVLVPTGNLALRALLREYPLRIPLDERKHAVTITKYRGSIMAYVDLNGRTIKMIPTIHPAAIYKQRAKKARGQEKANPGRTEKHCKFDWARIAAESKFREVAAPEEQYYIVDQLDDLDYWAMEWNGIDPETPVTIDIETPIRGRVGCVGFAWNPSFAISIPLDWDGLGPDHPTYAARRTLITRICESPNAKVLQNGHFDIWHLTRLEGIRVENYRYDLKYMHHCLDPCDDHDLGYMKSIFLRGQYHKDEAKGLLSRYSSTYEACLTYNGMDCCTQIALYHELQARLEAAGRWNLYETAYAPLLPILIDMMLGGMRVSRPARRQAHAVLTAETIDLQDRLAVLAGEKLHATKDLSPTKLKRFLYETLRLPPQRKRGARGEAGKVTTQEVTLRKLQLRFPQYCGDAITLILEHRRKLKLSQFLAETRIDDDDRLRCVYEPTTEAGRLSSSKNDGGTGTNLQNQDRDPLVRGSFIPDRPDHILLEVDCSQAESRVVYVLSGDDTLYDLALREPHDFDAHSYNAALIFGCPLDKVTKEQRYLGKKSVHGAQRGMGGDKLADELLKDNVVRTPDECQRMIDRYLREHPGINAYFEWVRGQVLREKRLTNSWGFCWDVSHEKMDAELYRRAYSFLPQSEVAFLLNVWGLIPIAEFLATWFPWIEQVRIASQVHDSIVLSIERRAPTIMAVCQALNDHLTQPRTYQTARGPRELSMPIEFKLGSTWVAEHEWKRLPTEHEVADALDAMDERRIQRMA